MHVDTVKSWFPGQRYLHAGGISVWCRVQGDILEIIEYKHKNCYYSWGT